MFDGGATAPHDDLAAHGEGGRVTEEQRVAPVGHQQIGAVVTEPPTFPGVGEAFELGEGVEIVNDGDAGRVRELNELAIDARQPLGEKIGSEIQVLLDHAGGHGHAPQL